MLPIRHEIPPIQLSLLPSISSAIDTRTIESWYTRLATISLGISESIQTLEDFAEWLTNLPTNETPLSTVISSNLPLFSWHHLWNEGLIFPEMTVGLLSSVRSLISRLETSKYLLASMSEEGNSGTPFRQ